MVKLFILQALFNIQKLPFGIRFQSIVTDLFDIISEGGVAFVELITALLDAIVGIFWVQGNPSGSPATTDHVTIYGVLLLLAFVRGLVMKLISWVKGMVAMRG